MSPSGAPATAALSGTGSQANTDAEADTAYNLSCTADSGAASASASGLRPGVGLKGYTFVEANSMPPSLHVHAEQYAEQHAEQLAGCVGEGEGGLALDGLPHAFAPFANEEEEEEQQHLAFRPEGLGPPLCVCQPTQAPPSPAAAHSQPEPEPEPEPHPVARGDARSRNQFDVESDGDRSPTRSCARTRAATIGETGGSCFAADGDSDSSASASARAKQQPEWTTTAAALALASASASGSIRATTTTSACEYEYSANERSTKKSGLQSTTQRALEVDGDETETMGNCWLRPQRDPRAMQRAAGVALVTHRLVVARSAQSRFELLVRSESSCSSVVCSFVKQ